MYFNVGLLLLCCICRYKKYCESKVSITLTDDNQASVSSFLSIANKYSSNHSRQRAITAAITSDLIVQCNMPLSLVENPSFRHFMEVVDHKYSHVSRNSVASSIESMVLKMKDTIRSSLQPVPCVSVTTDIWSDRQMRGFLGVTVHWMEVNEASVVAKSRLLGCSRFKGKHSGERICEAFEALCDDFCIKSKIDYIVCDNAANMRRAFTVCFLANTEEDEHEDSSGEHMVDMDDNDMWEDLEIGDQAEIEAVLFRNCRKQRLQCFAHTLQLVVCDGLKNTKVIRPALSKASRLSTLLHTSCKFKEAFELKFGKTKGIPADVCTRWHSTLRQVKCVVVLGHQALTELVEAEGHKEVVFSKKDWTQLEELVEVMEPLYEATVLCEGEKSVTISAVLPSVLSINNHLTRMSHKAVHLKNLVKSLQESLKKGSSVFLKTSV